MSQKLDRHYYALFKPYGYLCQFTGEPNDKLLGDLYNFPKDVYSIGRLDKDSEGLLLLSNDNQLKTRLLDPTSHTEKRYWVQVEGTITQEAITELSSGSITIAHKGKQHQVAKAKCKLIDKPNIEDRKPPIRFRANIPTSWIELTITEGKNRQVRKMTAAVGFPTLRLIRVGIAHISIEDMSPGEVKEIDPINL